MTPDADTTDVSTLPPDDAFEVLGDETRLDILRALGEADDPLSFSTLYDRVGSRDSGGFNYHLERLTGHFVHKSESGYSLRRAGYRVVEAVLSGALTDDPTPAQTQIDQSCWLCDAPIEVGWRAGSVEMYCTECSGQFGKHHEGVVEDGYLGRLPLPPAGLQNRTPEDTLWAAWTWGHVEMLSMAGGICPRCSATLEQDITVCGDHDTAEGLCRSCESRYASGIRFSCTNCVFEAGGGFVVTLLDDTDLLSFVTGRGLNPVSSTSLGPIGEVYSDYEEEILSVDPFEARFTFSIDEDRLTLTVEGTTVTDTTLHTG